MRVYFTSSQIQGCYAVRCLYPLIANGWDGDQTTIYPEQKTPEDKSRASNHADVAVFHRPDQPQHKEIAMLLKQAGKKIVFDNDDTYMDDGGFRFSEFMDEERLSRGMARVQNTLVDFIKISDLVTCSTEMLATEYRKLHDKVVVLPNCIDPFYFNEPLKNETNKVRIGIVGSLFATKDIELIEPIIRHYLNREDVQLVIFSLPPPDQDELNRKLYKEEYKFLDEIMKANNVQWVPFVMFSEYYDTLNELRLDISIIPRAETYFNKCKSNIKFIEMSMFEVPVIAQGFTNNDSPYEHGDDPKHMVIVKDNDKWIEAIETLVKDKDKRVELGKKAREYVLKTYNIEDHAQKWVEAYEKIYENN